MSLPGPTASVSLPSAAADPLEQKRSAKRADKKKAASQFWRATGYLFPHRRIVIISTICAFFVGLSMAGGLGTILPILNVLINGDTVPNWGNRRIVEHRLGVVIASEGTDLRVVHLDDGPGKTAGLRVGDSLAPDTVDQTAVLAHLSDPAVHQALLRVVSVHPAADRPVQIDSLRSVPLHWAIIRRGLVHFPAGPVSSVAMVLLVAVCISIVGNTIRFFQDYLSDKAAVLGVNDCRVQLYDHILHMPLNVLNVRGTSDVASRLLQDCGSLQDGFNNLLGQSIQMPINAAMAFAVALYTSWRLTAFIVLFGLVTFPVIKSFGKKMRRANRRSLEGGSLLLRQIEATMIGVRVVKGNGAERFERRRFSHIIGLLVKQSIRMSWLDALSSPIIEVLTLIVVCVVVIWATDLVQVKHELKPENFFLVMACLATIADAIRRLGKLNNVIQKSGAAAARIFEVLDVPVERPRLMAGRGNRPTISLPPLQHDIRFEHVTFRYDIAGGDNKQAALSDVSLTVRRGESVAIVGRNGSGKTTLAALLPRFYVPETGRVLIDGVDIQTATLRSLRNQISVVTQDSVLFPGTIAENIAYGHPLMGRLNDRTPAIRELRDQIEQAAKQAFAHDFILSKPQGYDTQMGELGGSLSGGQRQKITIARAILRATPILILDEATSNVDAESEDLIQQAIDGLIHQRTIFVIAHRLGTILSCDRIIVMDRGRIVGAGVHEDLLHTCETYASLYERQLVSPTARTPAAVG